MSDFDVVVAGAGVAGTATALQIHTLGLRVAVLGRPDIPAGYESLAPAAVHMLTSMSIGGCVPLPEIVAWWGDTGEHHVHLPDARVVEKKLLVESLRERAAEVGIKQFTLTGRFELQRADGLWCLRDSHALQGGATLRSTYLVDATGRASVIGRYLGARRIAFDSLASISFQINNPLVVGVWTESTADGWWNACCGSNGGMLSFFSSPQAIRESRRNISRYLEPARKIRSLFHLLPDPSSVPVIRLCSSSFLTPAAGVGWRAVGDAAWTGQPLASAGVAKALRDAHLVGQTLRGDDRNYHRGQTTEFVSYFHQLRRHYELESRWTTTPFWRDRRDKFVDLAIQ